MTQALSLPFFSHWTVWSLFTSYSLGLAALAQFRYLFNITLIYFFSSFSLQLKFQSLHVSGNYSWAWKRISPAAALSWKPLSQTGPSFSPRPHLYLSVAACIPRCKMEYSLCNSTKSIPTHQILQITWTQLLKLPTPQKKGSKSTHLAIS